MFIAFLAPLSYSSYAVTFLIWSVVGLGIMAPVGLLHAMYQNTKLSGKYHFRARYCLEKEHHEKQIRTYGVLVVIFISMVVGFSAASHMPAVVSFSDTVVWDVIKLIGLVKG